MESMLSGWRSWLAALLHREDVPPHLRRPSIRRRGNTVELQFARGVSQSAMVAGDPGRLLVDYTRTMLGVLVLVPRPGRIGMIGLGGGSQAKYCHRHLPQARIEVAENNPHVLALRRRFHVPDDDERFQVFLEDGARFLDQRRGRYDLLLVDGYDATGIPEALSTQAFYDDCHAALAEGGAMASNLYCKDADRHVERLRRAFGADRVRVIEEPRQSNRVAIAWTAPASASRLPGDADIALSAAARRDLATVFRSVRDVLASR